MKKGSIALLNATFLFLVNLRREALGQHEIGHSVVATGRGVLRLSSSISANVFCTESVATGTDVWHPLEEVKL